MRILIIEDNQQIAESLRRGLKSTFAVDVCHEGQLGIQQAEQVNYDLILLDLTLPDMKGEDVCRWLRMKGLEMPLIVLSGRDAVQTKVDLLDMGADDYMTKPFNIDEVKARMRLALRHTARTASRSLLKFEDVILDPAARSVERAGHPVKLRRKEFDILEYFMRNPNQTLTRPMIVGHIWDKGSNLWANVVDVHINHLREQIDKPFDRQLIVTIHGVGYKLQAKTPVKTPTVRSKAKTG